MNAAARRERELRETAARAARIRMGDAHPLALAVDELRLAARALHRVERVLLRLPAGVADEWSRELRQLEIGCNELAASMLDVRHRALARMLDGADVKTRRLHGLE